MRRLLSLLALLLLAATVYGQEVPSEPVFRVQYTVDTSLRSDADNVFAHPAIEALSKQEHMWSLDVGTPFAQRMEVKAVFNFRTLAQFQTWYAMEETRSLMRLLGEGSEPRAHLAVQRLQ